MYAAVSLNFELALEPHDAFDLLVEELSGALEAGGLALKLGRRARVSPGRARRLPRAAARAAAGWAADCLWLGPGLARDPRRPRADRLAAALLR